jgi:hypothetical protein
MCVGVFLLGEELPLQLLGVGLPFERDGAYLCEPIASVLLLDTPRKEPVL